MSLIYSLIARDQTVLCEYTISNAGGNFPTITRIVLREIAATSNSISKSITNETKGLSLSSSKYTFPYNNYHFHFLIYDKLVYLCMADTKIKTNIVFAMLDEMKNKFTHKYNEKGKTAIAYSMREFYTEIRSLMDKYESITMVDKFEEVHTKMQSVKDVMVQNINKVLERGEKIDMLVDKTMNLQHEALKFEKGATKLKRTMWLNNIKLFIAITIFGIILTWLFASLICGFDFSKCSAAAKKITN